MTSSNLVFLTAILHRGLRNCFSLRHIYFFHFFFGLLFPFSFWTFISLFFLDFYFPFFRTFISLFSLDFYFPFFFGLLFPFYFTSFFGLLFNRGHILDFFQSFLVLVEKAKAISKRLRHLGNLI